MTTEINDLPPTARTEATSITTHRFLDLQLIRGRRTAHQRHTAITMQKRHSKLNVRRDVFSSTILMKRYAGLADHFRTSVLIRSSAHSPKGAVFGAR